MPALGPGGMAWPLPEAALVEAPRRDRLRGWITHAGTVPGYNSDFGYLPRLKASIVVLTNTDIEATPGSAPSVAIMSALSQVIAPTDPTTP